MVLRLLTCLMFAALAIAVSACGGASSGMGSVTSPFKIWDEPLPDGTEFVAYSAELRTERGLGTPFEWRVASGQLPNGLLLVPETLNARIEGVPVGVGVFTFTLEVTDAEENIARKQFTVNIGTLPPGQLAIKAVGLPTAINTIAYDVEIEAKGGTGANYQWTILSGSLPPGLNHTPTGTPRCTITGTPQFTGVYSFTLRVQDSGGASATRALEILVCWPGSIVTFAGGPIPGFAGDGGPAAGSQLLGPHSVVSDSAGNIYIADFNNNRIRVVDARTGVISTLAGNGQGASTGDGGPASLAGLLNPIALAIDGQDNIYVCSSITVRRIDASTGIITTVAGNGSIGFSGDGGPATQAQLSQAHGICCDNAGNLYIADAANLRVRKVDAITGDIDTIAGTGTGGGSGGTGDGGPALLAELDEPRYVAVDSAGNLYIGEWGNSGNIRRVDAVTGDIETVAYLTQTEGMVIGPGDELYATDSVDNNVYRIDVVTHAAFDIAGSNSAGFSGDGGPATQAELYYPTSLCFDPQGNLYISDAGNHRVRKVLSP
ncbi:MAG: hypothetical protein IT462_15455 [Planctomycetes bacterium]|nr:hypothetical protein [Planctomycetota bacterium]